MHLSRKNICTLLLMFSTMIILMLSRSDVLKMKSLQPAVASRPKAQIPSIWNTYDEEAPSSIKSTIKEDYQEVIFNNTRQSRLIWESKEGKCSSFRVKFSKNGRLPMTMLASYPGSGNTWTRYLIEATTGIFTGSIYNSNILVKNGFLGEKEHASCGCTIVIKTHMAFKNNREKKLRVLPIIRNPYDTIITHRNFLYGGKVGLAPSHYFTGEGWNAFVNKRIIIWKRNVINWLTFGRVVGVVHYELLKSNLTSELTQIVESLNLKLDPERLLCTVKENEGKFHRKTPNDAFYKKNDPYSAKHHKLVDAAIHEVNLVLRRQNLRPLPLKLYNYMKK